MKGIKKTLRLCKMVSKLEPFFLVYVVLNSFDSVISLLMPIGIVQLIVGFFERKVNFWWVLVTTGAYALIYYLINTIYSYLNKTYSLKNRSFMAKFEAVIFDKIKEIDYDTYQSSAFLNDYTRAVDNGSNICMQSFWAVTRVVSSMVAIATIFSIFATLNPLIIVYAVIIGIIFYLIGKYNAKLYWNLSEKQKQNYRERGYIRRMFYLKDSTFDIRTSDVKHLFLDINDQVGDRVIRNTDKYLSLRAALSYAANFLVSSIYPFALAFLAYLSLRKVEIGTFAALTVAASSLSSVVQRMSDAMARLATQSAEGEAIFRVLDQTGTIERSGTQKAPEMNEISIKHADFSYGDKETLKDISLTIQKGEKIAIVGENGAGKTTLVKLLLRLYDVKCGEMTYNGEDYKDIIPHSLRKRIGAVFQDFEVYAFTVAENVLLRKAKTPEDEETVIKALQFSGLYEKVKTFPKGIHTMVTKEFDAEGVELSGGEKQKLAIARAFAGDYDLIILDEPNSALDPLAEAEIYDKMMKLGQDRTLLFISHRLSSTIKADKIYLFEEGKIVESGTHHELMSLEDGKYRYMFNVQAQKYVEGSAA